MDPNKPWEGDTPTKDAAETIGERLAALVAAEVVSQPVRGTVTKFINIGDEELDEQHEVGVDLYEHMWNTFIIVFKELMAITPEGMKARMEMAKSLMEDAAFARHRAAEMSITAVADHDVDSVPSIETTLRMSEESLQAANKLFDPVLTNINHLIGTAKSVEVMQQMQAKARAQMEDEVHDHKCDDPDCPGHTNH